MSSDFKDFSKDRMNELDDAMFKALTKACLVVESSAKTKARFDTGQMRDSFNYRVVKEGNEVVGYVGTNDDKFPHHEFGTGEFAENNLGRKGGWFYKTPDGKGHFTMGITPQPMLRPAIRENSIVIAELVKGTLREKLK